MIIQGICHASCIMTGHTLGHGEREKAQQQAWTFLILGLVVGILGGGLIKVLSRPIIGLYNITPETAQIAGELMDAIAFIVIFQSMNSILTKGVSVAVVIRNFSWWQILFFCGLRHCPLESGGAGMASGCFLDLCFSENRSDL